LDTPRPSLRAQELVSAVTMAEVAADDAAADRSRAAERLAVLRAAADGA